ncbi:NAD(P)-dependent oxidoreductase [Nocardioides renjunii]|uniref:NAD(P)-dependent oxidoreductase n=1 Tax=Nocardioides renjunii TaxID=3095075 RepID=UPI002AFE1311|nr:NAD(P)H-binding protein [Nocardioides sp. S-34]WQQ20468.1 NAD(P)H-binding protein [Nocardioides sp. S-34]
MRIVVLGATGRTGRPLVEELLRRGHTVVALVRDPVRLGDVAQRVDVVRGDSRSAADLDRLVTGADAVVSALGPTVKEASLHTDTATALVGAMQRAGVRRFVGVSGAGIDVPGDQKSLSARMISKAIQTFAGDVIKDKPAEYEVYAASNLDWTLVRTPRLVDGAATGRLEHFAHRSTRSTQVVRADLAAFVADVIDQGSYVRQAPFFATAK